ncbi:glycosyltransferase family 39 protein [Granulicella sibirica]|uniref:Glycosyltransferase RgtA/B/C/D-like domain-containing protein n=1 Tax=Granulicella sibirica TaxID=2479048 RepID=A0A4Q0T012_9BACT|nr:glycosyltransferase family 39 protein [Granulicella sibirica]RXH55248.1 hypothetical protein GRAN_4352 [Granulicella sibirica]
MDLAHEGRDGKLVERLVLLVSLIVLLMQSSVRPMEADEMYGYFTAAEPSAWAVLRTQMSAPISLDPPTYQLLSHGTMDVVGANSLGARLPSILGFLLMQWCLFVFVRRLAGVWAGWFAMIFPLATYTLHYAAQGRPYGWLLGMYGAALVCWQAAARREDEGIDEDRFWILVGLGAALVGAITSHFFGLLILIPICAAELARTFTRRKLDPGVLTAIAVGIASVATLLPFKAAVTIYREHYYTKMPGVRTVSLAYRRLFLEYPSSWGLGAQRNALIVLTAFVLGVFALAWLRFRKRPAGEPMADWVAVAVLAALPFFGYAFALVVTKTIEVRYVMPALLGLTILLALGLQPIFQKPAGAKIALGTVVVAAMVSIGGIGLMDLAARTALRQEMAHISDSGNGETLYTVDMGKFVTHWFYADDALRGRLTYVYSQEREIALMDHDVNYLTAIFMSKMAPTVRVASYEQFLEDSSDGTASLVVVYPDSGWDWMPRELRESSASVTPLGTALGGSLERVVVR